MIFYPHYRKEKIFDITPSFLEKEGIKYLLLDVDNTLTRHHTGKLEQGVKEWLDQMHEAGYPLIIASNSKDYRIAPFAKSIGLDYFALCCKPLPFKLKKGVKKLGCKKSECMLIGDQIFTDTLGARLAGIRVCLTEPFVEEEGTSFKIRRKLEKKIKSRYERKMSR